MLTPGIPAIVRYLWLIPALPIVAAGVGALLKQSRRKFAAAIAIASMTFSLVLAVIAFACVLPQPAFQTKNQSAGTR